MNSISWPQLIVAVLALAVVVALLWLFIAAIVKIAKSSGTGTEKAVWIVIVLIFPLLGPILWFTVGAKSLGARGSQQPPA